MARHLAAHRHQDHWSDADGIRLPTARPARCDWANDWRVLLRSWHRGRVCFRCKICECLGVFRRAAYRGRTESAAMAEHDASGSPAAAEQGAARFEESEPLAAARSRNSRREHLCYRTMYLV